MRRLRSCSFLILFTLSAPSVAAQEWTPLDSIGNAWNASAVYDPIRRRVVLYGGGSSTVNQAWAEPWIWDGSAWQPFAQSSGGERPDDLTGGAIAWDGVNGCILMYGGRRGSDLSTDTWAFRGDRWERLATGIAPPGRLLHAMAYDEARRRVVMFGGIYSQALDDTWEWDGRVWIRRSPTNHPVASFRNGMCYDRARQRIVLTRRHETWEWDGTNWQLMPATKPSHLAPIAYDSRRQRVVLFGGNEVGNASDDLWEYDGQVWTERLPAIRPPARQINAIAYDEGAGRTVMYGGWLGDFSEDPRTWSWDGATWSAVTGELRPEAAQGHMMAPFFAWPAYHIVLFGGSRLGARHSGETWVWDDRRWHPAQPTTSPPARAFGAVAYDTKRRRIVLFGGIAANGSELNDTWEWNGADWNRRQPRTVPAARLRHAMAYDQARERVVMYGGQTFNTAREDQWVWDGVDWVQVSASAAPGPRTGHAMAYNEFSRRVVTFGGRRSVIHGGPTDETWLWDGTAWSRAAPRTTPPRRLGHAMCFDAGSGRVLLHGGVDDSGLGLFDDTWEWDGADWARKLSVRTPLARSNHAIAYDFGRRRPLLVGGARADLLDDYWFFSPTPIGVDAYGQGCPRTGGPLRFSGLGAPRIGAGSLAAPFALELAGTAPGAPVAFLLGAQAASMQFGRCTVLVAPPFGVVPGVASTTGFATLPGALPANPALRGLRIHAQAITIDGGEAVTSAGLRIVIGD